MLMGPANLILAASSRVKQDLTPDNNLGVTLLRQNMISEIKNNFYSVSKKLNTKFLKYGDVQSELKYDVWQVENFKNKEG